MKFSTPRTVPSGSGVLSVIVHSHSAGERESLKHSLLRVAGALSMARHVDVYCACSREAARWKFMGECAERALIIKNGVDLDVFRFQREKRKQIREALQLPDSTLVVGHVGRFTYQKNHEFLIEVFAALAAKERDCHLLLIGDGEDRKRIREMAERLGLSDRVTMTGNVDNVSDYMQAMDVFVMPSRFEGLPIVGVEAQATGLPMVLSDAITREIALSDRVSFMSLKDGAPEWAGAIQRYRGCERVSDNAAIRRAGFDEKATARQIGALYKGEMAN